MKSHFFNLLQKHQRLDAHLQNETSRTWPDLMRIQQLKKLKLALKDQLMRAQIQMHRPIAARQKI
jgi:hypothetical protein